MESNTELVLLRLLKKAEEYGGIEGICNRLDSIHDRLEEIANGQNALRDVLKNMEDSLIAIEVNTE